MRLEDRSWSSVKYRLTRPESKRTKKKTVAVLQQKVQEKEYYEGQADNGKRQTQVASLLLYGHIEHVQSLQHDN